jgi:hypothetical protein
MDMAETLEAQGIMDELAASLNTIIRVRDTIQRISGTLDLVENIWQVITTIATGGIESLLVGLPQHVPVNGLEMVFESLAQNGSKALLLAAAQPIMLEKVFEYFSAKDPAFILYMPLPSPKLLIGTPLKIKGIPVKLFFGGANWMAGRLFGIGMLKNQNYRDPNLQIFRMDYHNYHGPSSNDLVPSWTDGPFHFHIPRP